MNFKSMSGGNDLALASGTSRGDGSFSNFLGSFHRPIPVRCNWSVFARTMRSTSEFAKIVLSKCVCVCACPCVCICGCLCMTGNPRIEERPKGHTPSVGLILWFSFFSGQSALVLQRMDVSSRFQHRSLEGEQC